MGFYIDDDLPYSCYLMHNILCGSLFGSIGRFVQYSATRDNIAKILASEHPCEYIH